jgi:hypothetical protein
VDLYDTFDPQAHPIVLSSAHYGTTTLRKGATSKDAVGSAATGFSNPAYEFSSAPQTTVYSSVNELK